MKSVYFFQSLVLVYIPLSVPREYLPPKGCENVSFVDILSELPRTLVLQGFAHLLSRIFRNFVTKHHTLFCFAVARCLASHQKIYVAEPAPRLDETASLTSN